MKMRIAAREFHVQIVYFLILLSHLTKQEQKHEHIMQFICMYTHFQQRNNNATVAFIINKTGFVLSTFSYIPISILCSFLCTIVRACSHVFVHEIETVKTVKKRTNKMPNG